MKLIDGLKLTGKTVEIPDCTRDDLPELFKVLDFKVGAEIGIYKGEYTKILLPLEQKYMLLIPI